MSGATSSPAVDWRFLALLAGVTALFAAPGWVVVDRWDGGRQGMLAGTAFSLASLALGFHWIRWSVASGGKAFVVAVMGSMTARIVATLAFALGLAFGTVANLAVALLTVVGMHIVFGLIEIVYLHRTESLG